VCACACVCVRNITHLTATYYPRTESIAFGSSGNHLTCSGEISGLNLGRGIWLFWSKLLVFVYFLSPSRPKPGQQVTNTFLHVLSNLLFMTMLTILCHIARVTGLLNHRNISIRLLRRHNLQNISLRSKLQKFENDCSLDSSVEVKIACVSNSWLPYAFMFRCSQNE
jgi:hypothetical protein